MAAPIAPLLEQAHDAIARQSWREAWAILQRAERMPAGSFAEDFQLMVATCLRHQGHLEQAEEIYRRLRSRLTLQDQRLADAIIGEAECAHVRCDFEAALLLGQAAERVPIPDAGLRLRVGTAVAHLDSHVNIDRAVQRFEYLLAHHELSDDTIAAHVTFTYADALLVAGDYDRATPMFLDAYQRAMRTGATITAADAMRRLPLARILLGQIDYALRGVNDLSLAIELYDVAGDRGSAYVHTEAGEVYRAIGKWREAEQSFRKGLWAAREIDDANRVAHNQLGLFEVSRATGSPDFKLLEEARESYQQIRSEWGFLHCVIAHGLADRERQDQLLAHAEQLIAQSQFSQFPRERELLARLRDAGADQVSREPHLKNYP
jgi:tetratricopeptide (TPR) repeat protein